MWRDPSVIPYEPRKRPAAASTRSCGDDRGGVGPQSRLLPRSRNLGARWTGPSALGRSRLDRGSGRYVIGERLARGGMAEVYLASQGGAGGFVKAVALKLVLPAFADDPEFRRMLLAEGRLSSGLNHPNIAQVLDVEELEGELFLALEYVHGRTVRALLRESTAAPPLAVTCEIGIRCARALAYAHDHVDTGGHPLEIVHRDISPSNLMVRYDGEVKLLDFGIAKASSGSSATRSGVLKGKGGYMSPEQCLGLPLDRRSDVFSLGIVLFELTTHRRLFRGDNDYEVMNRVVEGKVKRAREVSPDIPEALDELIARALSRDPKARFETASDMADALEAVNAALPTPGNAAQVAAEMTAVFGEAPPIAMPEPEDPRDFAPTRIVVGEAALLASTLAPPPPPQKQRPFALLAVAVAGVTLGGLAVSALSGASDPPASAAPGELGDARPTSESTAPPDRAQDDSARAPAPATAAPPTDVQVAAPPPVAAAPPATPLPSKPVKARGKKRPKQKSGRKSKRGSKPEREPLITW